MWFYDQYERTEEERERKTTEAMKKTDDIQINTVGLDQGITKIVDEYFSNLLL